MLNHDTDANANLIAAAPDLLAALEQINAVFAGVRLPEVCLPAILDMRAAIAKAKGEVCP